MYSGNCRMGARQQQRCRGPVARVEDCQIALPPHLGKVQPLVLKTQCLGLKAFLKLRVLCLRIDQRGATQLTEQRQ